MSKFTIVMVSAIAVLGVYAAIKQHMQTSALADHGVPTVAQVVSLEVRRNTVTHLETSLMAALRFQTEKGEMVNTRVSISSDLANAIRRGTVRTVNVRYLAESASQAEIVDVH